MGACCRRPPRTLSPVQECGAAVGSMHPRSEEHTSELQSRLHLVCRLLLEKQNKIDAHAMPPAHPEDIRTRAAEERLRLLHGHAGSFEIAHAPLISLTGLAPMSCAASSSSA